MFILLGTRAGMGTAGGSRGSWELQGEPCERARSERPRAAALGVRQRHAWEVKSEGINQLGGKTLFSLRFFVMRAEPSSGYFSRIVVRNGVRHGKNARVRQGWREAESELPAAVLPRGGIHIWLCRNRHTPGYDLFFGKPQRRSKSETIVGLLGQVWLTRELLSLIL